MAKGKTFRPYRIEDGITQSLLSAFVDCRQQCRYILDMWRMPRPKDALVFGGLWHWLLQQCYEEIRRTGKIIPFQVLAKRWFQEYGRKVCDTQAAEEHLAMAEALFDPYWKFWKEDFKRKWIAVEKKFDVQWNGFRLRGMRDGGYTLRRRPWILETKTAGQISEDTLEDKLAFDFQNLFYLVTAEEEIGKEIQGVLYNVIRKPMLRRGKAESLPEFSTRMREDVLSRPSWYFDHRWEILYTRERIKEFSEELLDKLVEFTCWVGRADSKAPSTYKNEAACIKRWTCEFLPACAQRSLAGYIQDRELFSELGGR